MARASQADVFRELVTDLQEAESLLTEEYPTGQPVRANKFAAMALLARVYLFQADWQNAGTNGISE